MHTATSFMLIKVFSALSMFLKLSMLPPRGVEGGGGGGGGGATGLLNKGEEGGTTGFLV